MGPTRPRPPRAGLRRDVAELRRLFTLVPWRMRWVLLGLAATAALSALLDMLAVASMLPLTQMLASPGVLPPLVRSYIVPLIGTEQRSTVLLALALLVAAAFVTKNVALIGIRWWSLGITTRAEATAQSALLHRYLAAPYLQHRRRSHAVILQVITGSIPTAMRQVMLGYITLGVYGLTVVLLFAVLVVVAPLASCIAVVVFGGSSLLISRVLKPIALRNAHRALDIATDGWRLLNPAIEGFREARIFTRERHFTAAFEQNRESHARLSRLQSFLGELPKYLLEVVMVVGILAVALVLFATNDESTAFGLLAMFAAAAVRVIPSLNILVATYNGIVAGRPSLSMAVEQLDDLDEHGSLDIDSDPHAEKIPVADIEVSGLGFRYPDGGKDVLTGVSVSIPAGSTVALVGGSGAGKTTFADILAGLLSPTAGTITVGGTDVIDRPRAWLANVAMVSQRVYLWDSSLRNLITFGQLPEEIDEELLSDVVRRARLDDFVGGLPDGLDTWIGDGGARLSGGQAQRVGIARALYAEPEVLILDEATSALDNETEYEITRTIEDLHGELTVIVIAHRLSTVKNADEILFFSGGRLRASGTMAELRETEPEFARLVALGRID